MAKYKSIIIGCGKIAGLYDESEDEYIYSHAKAYTINKNIDLVCCCDLDIDKAKGLAYKFNVDFINDNYIDSINKHHPDIISVCTPDDTHFDVVMSILDSSDLPKIIFLEKPACKNEEQLIKLVSISNKKDIKIVVNHSRRFDKLHKELKSKIEKNEFGKLIKADIVYYSGWQHNGVHIVDTLNFLFSDKLEFEKLLNYSKSPYEGDFNIDFKCKFKNNGALVYLTTIDEKYYQLFEFDFKFERARIRIEDFGQRISYEKKVTNNMNENILVKEEYFNKTNSKSPMQSAIEIMIDNLENNKSLEGYQIKDISQTMKTIWEGMSWVR